MPFSGNSKLMPIHIHRVLQVSFLHKVFSRGSLPHVQLFEQTNVRLCGCDYKIIANLRGGKRKEENIL